MLTRTREACIVRANTHILAAVMNQRFTNFGTRPPPASPRRRYLVVAAVAGLAMIAPAMAAPAVTDAWSPQPPPGARTAAVYLTLTGDDSDDRIVAVRTDAARVAELHTHVHSDGMMRMQRLDVIDVPAREDVVFKPHGLHIMLIDLTGSPVAGQQLTVTLTLERAGDITFAAAVRDLRK